METLNLHLAQYTAPATGPRFPRKPAREARATASEAVRGARVVLRTATLQDSAAIAQLAELDGARRPEGTVLVAEVDGQIVAALPVDGGRAIADPFRPTAHLVELLTLQMKLVGARDALAPRRRLPFRTRGMRLAA